MASVKKSTGKKSSSKKSLVVSKKISKSDIGKHHSFSVVAREPSEIILKSIKYSAPPGLLCDVLRKLSFAPLQTFPAVDNSEIPRITVWVPFTRQHIEYLKQYNEDDTLNLIGTGFLVLFIFYYHIKFLPLKFTINRKLNC